MRASTSELKKLVTPTPLPATAPPRPMAMATEPAKATESTVAVESASTLTLPVAPTVEVSIKAMTLFNWTEPVKADGVLKGLLEASLLVLALSLRSMPGSLTPIRV